MKFTSHLFLFVLMLCAMPLSSLAQSFAVPVEYLVGSQPFSVAVGDFNGDGRIDFAAANNTSQNVSVLLGNGDATFGPKTDYPVAAYASGIVAVDLNKDGKLDLASANSINISATISVLLGNGDGTFQSKVDSSFTGLMQPDALRSADFNADTKPDLVVVNGSGVTVFIGKGDGTFNAPVNYGSLNFATSVVVADFNADTKPDLAVSSYGNSNGLISIMLGNGDGTFSAPTNFDAGVSPFGLAKGDFNGDGKIDLATTNIQVNTISVLLGNGDATFQARVSYPAGQPYEIAVADFNNDGKSDIVSAGNGFGLYTLKGNGDGSFGALNTIQYGANFATPIDLNGDGKPDLLTSSKGNSVGVLINNSGPFTVSGSIKDSNAAALSNVAVTLTGGAPRTVTTDAAGGYAFGDLGSSATYTVTPFKSNYVFAPANQSFSNLASNVTADFTGTLLNYSISGIVRDNFLNRMQGVVVTLTGDRTGTVTTAADGSFSFSDLPGGGNYSLTPTFSRFVFSPPTTNIGNLSANRTVFLTGSLATFSISGVIKDGVNGFSLDGLPIVLSGSSIKTTFTSQGYNFSGLPIDGDYTVTAYTATGNQLFTNYLLSPPTSQTFNRLTSNVTANFTGRSLFFPAGPTPSGIAHGDLNGDGKPDLVVSDSTGVNIQVLIGNGDGTFKTPVAYAAAGNPFDVVVADLDRDGKLDVAVADGGSAVSVLLGNGDGTLKTAVNYAVPGQATTLCVSDLNGDSKPDLAVLTSGPSGANLHLLMGNGDGTFAAEISKSVSAGASILAGDFNSDNKPDLVMLGSVGSQPSGVLILLGQGDGTFADATTFAAGSEVRKLTVADLNVDGKLDVAVSNNRGFNILLGNGNGTFQAPIANSLTVDTSDIAAADFDGDGKSDLAIAGASGGLFFVPGNGNGTFNGATVYQTGSNNTGLVARDLNGDGKLDLAVSSLSDSVAILLNASLTRLPSIQFGAANLSVNENAGSALVTVTRTTGMSSASKVDYLTSDSAGTQPCTSINHTASSRCDYTPAIGTLEFAPGETAKTISIPLVDDAYAEGSESFFLNLTNVSGASIGSPSQLTINIADDDTSNGPDPVDATSFFVSQNYRDFLNRQPDQSGLDFWVNTIASCGNDPQCIEVKRINMSAAFFLSIEFQETGYLVERLYKTAYGDATGTSTFPSTHTLPVPVVRFNEFLTDTQEIGRGVVVGQGDWQHQLETNKQAFIAEFAQRLRFITPYGVLSNSQFVDRLNLNAGSPLSQSERDQLVTDLNNSVKTRAQVLRAIAEHPNLVSSEFNRAFVLMQFFGYLRRNPNDPQDTDYTGFDFWLTKLNQFGGNFQNAEMVKAFISSDEYRHRFGP
jgi:Calx-beta domain/FG-GAP-like repeat/Carboxypeptidase regulatory-like domain/Domain of unknown function (DUF4214)